MKLRNSLQPLRDALAELFTDEPTYQDNFIAHSFYINSEYAKKEKTKRFGDVSRRLRWDMWWAVARFERNDILAASVPRDEWVGGYPDITDEHINTLLRNVIDPVTDAALAGQPREKVFASIVRG